MSSLRPPCSAWLISSGFFVNPLDGLTRLRNRGRWNSRSCLSFEHPWRNAGGFRQGKTILGSRVIFDSSWNDSKILVTRSARKWRRVCKGRRIECCCSQAGGDLPTSSVLPHAKPKATGIGYGITFCPRCGGATEQKIPSGEHEMRAVCTACGAIHYQNPKMVVGCLVEHQDQVLLCKRSIEPSYGLWTLPAGFMEIGESAAEGAARETREEACAEVEVLGLFAHLDIPIIGQCRAI